MHTDPLPHLHTLHELECELIQCRRCQRLTAWREQVAREKRRAFREEPYWGKPVPGFGDPQARLLIVGLAPGAHGSNRTGRMFTGDASGEFLYAALHRAGFASQPRSLHRQDDLTLQDCYITAVGRCAPPDNKPTPQELTNCQPYLLKEIALLPNLQGMVALGKIAFDELRRIFALPALTFAHGAFYRFEDRAQTWLLASYHPSRQNTQTGRLTAAMFDTIWQKASEELERD